MPACARSGSGNRRAGASSRMVEAGAAPSASPPGRRLRSEVEGCDVVGAGRAVSASFEASATVPSSLPDRSAKNRTARPSTAPVAATANGTRLRRFLFCGRVMTRFNSPFAFRRSSACPVLCRHLFCARRTKPPHGETPSAEKRYGLAPAFARQRLRTYGYDGLRAHPFPWSPCL